MGASRGLEPGGWWRAYLGYLNGSGVDAAG